MVFDPVFTYSTDVRSSTKTIINAHRDVNEAEANSRGRGQLLRGRGQNCINFFSQILHFDPIFFQKTEIFSRFSTELKFRVKAGFNMGTLLVNTPNDQLHIWKQATASVSTH